MRRRSIRGPSDEAPTRRQGNLHRREQICRFSIENVSMAEQVFPFSKGEFRCSYLLNMSFVTNIIQILLFFNVIISSPINLAISIPFFSRYNFSINSVRRINSQKLIQRHFQIQFLNRQKNVQKYLFISYESIPLNLLPPRV